jgi:hypothetical protein
VDAPPDSDQDLDTTDWDPGLTRLYRYWCAIHPASGVLPGRQHFDPVDIPDLLPGIALLNVQRAPFRLRYRLVGTAVVHALGREVTGLWLDEAHRGKFEGGASAERCRLAVDRAMPDWHKGGSLLSPRREIAAVETLLLPLARDGRSVDMLCSYSVFYRRDGSASC